MKIKVPFLKHYHGSGDPDYPLQNYRNDMQPKGATEPLICLAFLLSIRKAEEWFNNLPRGLITSFRDLDYAFSNQFSSSNKRKKTKACLISGSQKKNLREYIQRINTEWLDVGTCNDDVVMVAFTVSHSKRKSKDLVRSLYLNLSEDFDSTISRAMENLLADESQDSSDYEEQKLSKKQEKNPPPSDHWQGNPLPLHRNTTPCSIVLVPKFSLKEEGYTIQTSPPIDTRRNKNLYYRYQRDYEHDTNNCYHLKEEIEKITARGHLKRFFLMLLIGRRKKRARRRKNWKDQRASN